MDDHRNKSIAPIAPTHELEQRYLKLKRKDIAYLQFILEGYEGLVTATTIDKNKAIVKLFIIPDASRDVSAILDALKEEIDFHEIDRAEI